MADTPKNGNGNGGWTRGPIPAVVAGVVGVGSGFGSLEVATTRIDNLTTWVSQLHERTDAQDVEFTTLRRELNVEIESLRDKTNAEIKDLRERSVDKELSLDRIKHFDGLLTQFDARLGRLQDELNKLRDRFGERRTDNHSGSRVKKL